MAASADADLPLLSERRYEDLAVGERWGPFAQELDADACDRLRGEPGLAVAGVGAPPGILPALCLWGLRRALRGIIPGGVLVRQHFRSLAPGASPGTFAVEIRVTERHQRPSGLYTSFVFGIGQAGVLVALGEWTILAPSAGAAA